MNKKQFTLILICFLLFLTIGPVYLANADDKPWFVWRRKAECSIMRQDWLAVSQDKPVGFGWMVCNGSTTQFTFAASAAEMDVLKMSECQGETPSCPKFQIDCCKFSVWQNTTSGAMTVIGAGKSPGQGWLPAAGIPTEMCCEDAAIAAGMPTMGCTEFALTSVPGARVRKIGDRWASVGAAITIPTNPPVVVASGGGTGGGSLGCFKDPNHPFDLDGHLVRSAANTPQRCSQICKEKGFAYAGVQYGESCLCGNSYGRFGAADNCNMRCTGDPNQTCGGINANYVYSTSAP